jgi:GR25 family glycosyltransferase involved in LPS biosynthesis
MKYKTNIVLISVFVLIAFLFIYRIIWPPVYLHPHVKSIHVINRDEDKERWNSVFKDVAIRPVRWPATNAKDIQRHILLDLGIGYSTFNAKKEILGQYLSHRFLLEYLSSLNAPDYYGHLILEDTADIPHDFLKTSDEWHKFYKKVPTDWDIFYFDIVKPNGVPLGNNVVKLRHTKGDETYNRGTHAYMVKHSSIKEKILPWLQYMVDEIDQQYKLKFNEWNVYCLESSIIKKRF